MNSLDNKQQIKKKSIKSNFLFNFISQILVLLIPLVTSPYLARVLGVEINGRISFAFSIITYFTLISNFGFTVYGQRTIAKLQDDVEKRSKAYWEIFILRTLFTVVSLSILIGLIFANVFEEKYKTFLMIQIITVFACCIDPTFYYQGMEEFKLIAIRTVLIKLVGLVLIFIFIKTPNDAWLYVLFNAGATFVSYLVMWPLIFKQTHFVKLANLNIWQHFKPALLIFLPNLSITIYSVLDKTMIGVLASNPDYANGCYEKAYELNSIMLLLVTLTDAVMIPRNAHDFVINDYDSIDKHLKFSFNYVWLTSLPMIAGCLVLSSSLSSWFLGQGYDDVPIILQIMSIRFVASGINNVVSNQYFVASGKEKYCTIATFAGALFNFSLNILFIKLWGAIGAAITTAATEVLVATVLVFIALKNKYMKFNFIFGGMVKKLIAACIMFIPIYFLNKCFDYNVWTFLLITLIGAAAYAVILFILRDQFFISLIRQGIANIKLFISKNKLSKKE